MTGKFLSLTALCLFSILTLTGATLDGDFVRGSNLRLLHDGIFRLLFLLGVLNGARRA